MDIKDIEQLISVINKTDLTEVEIERDGVRVSIKREAPSVVQAVSPQIVTQEYVAAPVAAAPQAQVSAAPQASTTVDATAGLHKVESPIVGTFYRKPSPDAEPFAQVGQTVKKGDTLCIVEAMKLMNEIEADKDGIIEQVLIEDGSVVEFGEALFLIRPN
jgi:acetyl-CoA carboxylase biotin carboxyl carrier protein